MTGVNTQLVDDALYARGLRNFYETMGSNWAF